MSPRSSCPSSRGDAPSATSEAFHLSIRPYRPADHATLAALNAYGLAAAGVPANADVYSGDLDDNAAAYHTDRAALLVGEIHGMVVAMGGLRPVDADTCEILRMRVAPSHQGHGHGRALLMALEDRARQYGYARALLLTGPDQHPAVDLYRSAGYVEQDRQYFGDLDGIYLTRHL
jgi:ribosomal protein S18 acetylase RimI-like enzyme